MLYVLPGQGIADPMGKIGFFPNTSDGIDALNLDTGKVLWSSKEANLPFIATRRHLFALSGNGNQLRVIKMDTSNHGACLFESPLIPLPSWASVSIQYGRSFRSSARLDSNGLFLIWEARSFYSGGVEPPPDILASSTKYQSGVESIDKDSGKIESLGIKEIADGKFFPISKVEANPKLDSLTLLVKDGSVNFQTFKRSQILQAVNEVKHIVWQHDIAPLLELPNIP